MAGGRGGFAPVAAPGAAATLLSAGGSFENARPPPSRVFLLGVAEPRAAGKGLLEAAISPTFSWRAGFHPPVRSWTGAKPLNSRMRMMQSVNDIRRSFLDYFAANGHTVVSSSPLVPFESPE